MSDLAEAQRSAVEEVKRLTDSSNQITLIAAGEWRGYAVLNIEIDTSDFARRTGGLQAQPRERVTVLIASNHPTTPPLAAVDHLRWAGFPHVLQGTRLCLYLDPGTEWDPTRGMQGFLWRLWEWFEDAIGGRFDAATALYHPVGGVLHRTEALPRWWRPSRYRAMSPMMASYAASGCGREPIIELTSHRGRHRSSPDWCPACLSSSPSTCHWAAAIICRIS